jgi:hypothetical protein
LLLGATAGSVQDCGEPAGPAGTTSTTPSTVTPAQVRQRW